MSVLRPLGSLRILEAHQDPDRLTEQAIPLKGFIPGTLFRDSDSDSRILKEHLREKQPWRGAKAAVQLRVPHSRRES